MLEEADVIAGCVVWPVPKLLEPFFGASHLDRLEVADVDDYVALKRKTLSPRR